ncbi:hypothetical protein HDV00_002114 [Rhizophlyctis rosea]|nr:hypothetical protein HDV00_002114 [Rhizophlyctis rosea]
MKHVGELHALMSRQLRELAERVQRDVEEPVHKSIDEHNAHVAWNEKNILQMKNGIQDKIKKAESETRKKKSRDPDQLQQALKNLNAYTAELHDLKFVHQRAILNEETRNVRKIQSHWSALLRRQSEMHSGWGLSGYKIAEELVKPIGAESQNGSLPRSQDDVKGAEKYGASRQSMDQERAKALQRERTSNAAVGPLPLRPSSAGPPPRTDSKQQQQQQPQNYKTVAGPHNPQNNGTTQSQPSSKLGPEFISSSAPASHTHLSRRGSLDSNTGSFTNAIQLDTPLLGSLSLERTSSSSTLDDVKLARSPHIPVTATNNSSLASTLSVTPAATVKQPQPPSVTTTAATIPPVAATTAVPSTTTATTTPAIPPHVTQTATPPPSPPTLPQSALTKPATTNDDKTKDKEKKRVRFPHQQPIATVATESDSEDEDLTSLEVPTHPTTATPGNLQSTLSTLYPHIFGSERPALSSVPVQRVAVSGKDSSGSVGSASGLNLMNSNPTKGSVTPPSASGSVRMVAVKMPEVYVSQEADVESQMGSVVGVSESLVGLPKEVDMVYAIHDFTARSAKEMSLAKGDVITVRKRQGTWIYGTKVPRSKTPGGGAGAGQQAANAANNKSFTDRFRRGPPQAGGGGAGESQSGGAAGETPAVGWIPMAFVAKFSPN